MADKTIQGAECRDVLAARMGSPKKVYCQIP
jgi:hypothetical protein